MAARTEVTSADCGDTAALVLLSKADDVGEKKCWAAMI